MPFCFFLDHLQATIDAIIAFSQNTFHTTTQKRWKHKEKKEGKKIVKKGMNSSPRFLIPP
jgi:hypothetical protein